MKNLRNREFYLYTMFIFMQFLSGTVLILMAVIPNNVLRALSVTCGVIWFVHGIFTYLGLKDLNDHEHLRKKFEDLSDASFDPRDW